MVTRTRVKICGITNAQDLTCAVEAGADAIGFVFYAPSPRAVDLNQARVLMDKVPAFVTKVGLFVNEAHETVSAIADTLKLDLLQFHGDESPEYCSRFKQTYIKAVRVKPDLNLVQYASAYPDAAGILLDAYVAGVPGGTGERFDWRLIPATLPLPVILAGGLDEGNVAEAIRQVRPWAVDVSGGVEYAKGMKDHQKVRAFINAVNQA